MFGLNIRGAAATHEIAAVLTSRVLNNILAVMRGVQVLNEAEREFQNERERSHVVASYQSSRHPLARASLAASSGTLV